MIETLRSVHFGKFVDSDKFSGLMTVKSGLPMAIMVEKEFGEEIVSRASLLRPQNTPKDAWNGQNNFEKKN